MAQLICPNCSKIVESTDASPSQCPECGYTFPIADDSTYSRLRAASTVIAPPEEELPRQIGRYLILRQLGKGGFGIVYLARDPQLDQLVAIKIPRADTGMHPTALRRFEREGRNAARLRRDGIVRVLTVEYEGAVPFIVSEYVEGMTLTDRLKDGPPFTFRESAQLVATLAAAIEYAHSQDVIHRDIKPSNILIATDGKPWLMDFGLAMRESLDESIAMPTHIIGTPGYMSPEQASGKQKVDRRTDIYSLGVVLYQLLTREVPFRGEMRMVLRQVIEEDPRNPRSLNADIPLDLETICETAMRKEVKSRYQTAGELAEELDCYLENKPIKARPITRLERAWRWSRRHPARAGLIASVVLLLALSTGGAFGFAAVADKGRKEAVGRQLAEANARESAEESRDKEAALRKVEAEARKEAEASERRINEALQRNQELLSRAYVEKGSRYMRAPESSDEYNPIKSLPWFLEAMKIDEKNPTRLLDDRIRIQTALDSAPRIERMWFFKGAVNAAGVSPKRDMFFIAGENGNVNIWRIAGDNAPVVLSHPVSVTAAAFSPAGSRLVTGANDGVRIWETASGKCAIGPFAPPRSSLNRSGSDVYERWLLSFSRSGRYLFTHNLTAGNQVWTVETGQRVGKTSFSLPVSTADFADSDRLLVLNFDGSTRVYDVLTGLEKRKLEGGQDRFTAAKLSPDGVTVANFARSGRVVLWNAVNGQEIGPPLAPDSDANLSIADFSPDGKLIATASEDGTVRIWNVSDGQLLSRQQPISGPIDHLQFSASSSTVAVAQMRQKLCTLAARSGRFVAEPISMAAKLKSADWLASSEQILTVDQAGIARLWNIANLVSTTMMPLDSARQAGISSDGRVLAACGSGKTVCILQSPMGDRFDALGAQFLEIGDLKVDALALTDDGSRIAISAERNVLVFDTASDSRVCGPLEHDSIVPTIRFTPDGKRLVSVSYGGRAAVWDVTTGTRLGETIDVSPKPTDIDIDTQGKQCAVAAKNGTTIWEIATGKRIRPGFLGERLPWFVRFLGDATRILIAFPAGRPTQIWDITTGQPLLSLAYRSNLQCFDLSGDKRNFLTGYSDGTARLWSTQDVAPASRPFEHRSALRVATIDTTGRFVLTITDDLNLSLWTAESAELLGAVSLGPVLLRFGLTDSAPTNPRALKPLAFFARDSRTAYFLTHQGLLVSLHLFPDSRSAAQLAADVAIRSGSEFDQAGGLRTLQWQDVAARWNICNRSMPRQARAASHIPAGFGAASRSTDQLARAGRHEGQIDD